MAMGRVTRRARSIRRSPGCAGPQGSREWLNMAFIPRNYQVLSEPSPVTSFPPGTGVWHRGVAQHSVCDCCPPGMLGAGLS